MTVLLIYQVIRMASVNFSQCLKYNNLQTDSSYNRKAAFEWHLVYNSPWVFHQWGKKCQNADKFGL